MANRSDIAAGKAHVTLYVRNSDLIKGITAAKKSMQDFGSQIMGIGGWMTGISAALLTPMVAAIAHFDAVGSKLQDLSVKTGVAAGTLGELGYAAGQTGSGLDAVAGGLTKLNKKIAEAFEGGKTNEARKFFQDMGISLEQLKGLNGDEVMEKIADKIAGTSDAAERTKIAMDAFGKSGTELIPMLAGGSAGLQKMREEARSLGSLMDEEAAAADEFGDSLGRLKTLGSNMAAVFGSQLAPMVQEWVELATSAGQAVIGWVRENGELFRTVLKVAVGVGAAGAALVALGGSLSFIGWAVGGITMLATAFGSLAAILAPIFTPIALGVVILGSALSIFWQLGGSIKDVAKSIPGLGTAMNWVGGVFGSIGEYFSDILGNMSAVFGETWKGITDAIAAGDLKLAMDIAWAGINVVWQIGVNEIKKLWNGFSYGVASTMLSAFAKIHQAWIETVYAMGRVMTYLTNVGTLVWLNFKRAGMLATIDLMEKAGRISKDEATVGRAAVHGKIKAEFQERQTKNAVETAVANSQRDAALKKSRDGNAAAQKILLDDHLRMMAEGDAKVEAAKRALGEKTSEAEVMRMLVGKGKPLPPLPKAPGIGDLPSTAQLAKSIGPTFSANAIMNIAGGKEDKVAEVVKEAKLSRKEQEKLRKVSEGILHELGRIKPSFGT